MSDIKIEKINKQVSRYITIKNKKDNKKTRFVLIEEEDLQNNYNYIKFKDGYLFHYENVHLLTDKFGNQLQYKIPEPDIIDNMLILFMIDIFLLTISKLSLIHLSYLFLLIINIVIIANILINEKRKEKTKIHQKIKINDYINVDKIENETQEVIKIKNIHIDDYFNFETEIKSEKEIKDVEFSINNKEKINI